MLLHPFCHTFLREQIRKKNQNGVNMHGAMLRVTPRSYPFMLCPLLKGRNCSYFGQLNISQIFLMKLKDSRVYRDDQISAVLMCE